MIVLPELCITWGYTRGGSVLQEKSPGREAKEELLHTGIYDRYDAIVFVGLHSAYKGKLYNAV